MIGHINSSRLVYMLYINAGPSTGKYYNIVYLLLARESVEELDWI
jgi:hypothetical protein